MAAVYLAGPDVFLADAIDVGRVKKAHCSDHGLVGVFPLDAELALAHQDGISERIFNANVALIGQCAAVVANITPFRGLSVDPGTAFGRHERGEFRPRGQSHDRGSGALAGLGDRRAGREPGASLHGS